MVPIRVGLVGLGEVAQTVHIPILGELRDRFAITAVCDIAPSLLQAIGDRLHLPPSARHVDFRDLAQQADVDLVFVLNANEYHAETAIAAMNAGKHVFVEKPMCMTIAEAEAMREARDRNGVLCMVGYMRRFAAAFTDAVDRVRALDRIDYVRVRDIIGPNRLFIDQVHDVLYPTDIPAAAVADRQERFAERARTALGDAAEQWSRTWGFLLGLSSHDLSAMRELVGTPHRVIAAHQHAPGGYITAILDFGDFPGIFETGTNRIARFDAHIQVYGADTSIRVDWDTPYIRHLPTTLTVEHTSGHDLTVERILPTYTDPYSIELRHLYDLITTGGQPKTSIEDSMEDLRLFQAIVHALAAAR